MLQSRRPSQDDQRLSAAPMADAHVNVRSVALTVIAVAAGMYILQWAQEVFIPIVLSLLIGYALEPVVVGLTRLKLPRILASALTVTMLAGTIGYGGYSLSDDAAAIVAQLPEAAAKLRQTLRDGRSRGDRLRQP